MRLNRKDQPTPAEWKIMRIIWRNKACAARDVYQEAGEKHEWSVSTVKTLLRRLVEKGYLTTTQVGNSFLYRPAFSAVKLMIRAADGLLENAMEGTVGPLIAHMVRRSELSREEIRELKLLIERCESESEEMK